MATAAVGGGGDAAGATASLEFVAPGEPVPPSDHATRILLRVRQLCGWGQERFPGCQPVSLTRSNMREIGRQPYVACEKSDGVRFLLFAILGDIYFIDRQENLTKLRMHLPRPEDLDEAQAYTLLDGELVRDAVAGGPARLRYLIYDAVSVDDDGVGACNLIERLARVRSDVLEPRRRWEQRHPQTVQIERETGNFVELYLKDFFEVWDVPAIMALAPRLPHLSDGIIFTPVEMPYMPGTCQQLLKWKPPHLNTVDFAAEIVTEAQTLQAQSDAQKRHSNRPVAVRLYVAQHGRTVFRNMWLSLETAGVQKVLAEFQAGRDELRSGIWECYFDETLQTHAPRWEFNDSGEIFDTDNCETTDGAWCFERIRTDRTTPNDERVVERVKDSIRDGIQIEDLVKMFEEYRLNGKRTVSENCEMPLCNQVHGSKMYVERCAAAAKKAAAAAAAGPQPPTAIR